MRAKTVPVNFTIGKYAKLLSAYAKLVGLTMEVKADNVLATVDVYVRTRWYDSVVDVFKEGRVAYVSSMRQIASNLHEGTVEELCKKILEGTFGERRYLMSMKGGDGYQITKDGSLEFCPRWENRNIPRSMDELLMRLDLAGINWQKCTLDI